MRRIEDQVSALAACEHSVAETTQLAEQRIARADAERRAAEERWQAAHTALQAAHDELESVRYTSPGTAMHAWERGERLLLLLLHMSCNSCRFGCALSVQLGRWMLQHVALCGFLPARYTFAV
jgi:hypothetical protein